MKTDDEATLERCEAQILERNLAADNAYMADEAAAFAPAEREAEDEKGVDNIYGNTFAQWLRSNSLAIAAAAKTQRARNGGSTMAKMPKWLTQEELLRAIREAVLPGTRPEQPSTPPTQEEHEQ